MKKGKLKNKRDPKANKRDPKANKRDPKANKRDPKANKRDPKVPRRKKRQREKVNKRDPKANKREKIKKTPNLIKQHCSLITSNYCKTMTPKFKTSRWVGISCLSIILPFFFIKGQSLFAYFLRTLCLLQLPIAFLSDYIYACDEHIIHGIDRIIATISLMTVIYVTANYNSIKKTLVYIFIPILTIGLSKYYCNTENEECYNIAHILWHYSTTLIISYVIYDIDKRGNTL
jgi:hypothetical protein